MPRRNEHVRRERHGFLVLGAELRGEPLELAAISRMHPDSAAQALKAHEDAQRDQLIAAMMKRNVQRFSELRIAAFLDYFGYNFGDTVFVAAVGECVILPMCEQCMHIHVQLVGKERKVMLTFREFGLGVRKRVIT
jgi:hypothetical protein